MPSTSLTAIQSPVGAGVKASGAVVSGGSETPSALGICSSLEVTGAVGISAVDRLVFADNGDGGGVGKSDAGDDDSGDDEVDDDSRAGDDDSSDDGDNDSDDNDEEAADGDDDEDDNDDNSASGGEGLAITESEQMAPASSS